MINYYDLVIKGFFQNKKYYSSYLLRKSKEAKVDFIEKEEFFGRCIDVLEDEIEKQREYASKKKLEDSAVKASVFVLMNDDVNDLHQVFYNISLLQEIKDLIAAVMDKAGVEKEEENGLSSPPEEESKEVNLHKDIFKDNYFLLFELLFERFKIEKSSCSDIKFLYDEMKYEGFIVERIKYSDFLTWVSEVYETEIGRVSGSKSNKGRKAMFDLCLNAFKEKDKSEKL